METDAGWCEACGYVRCWRYLFPWTGHFFLSIITCGLWVPIALLKACWPRPWCCPHCLRQVHIVGKRRVEAILREEGLLPPLPVKPRPVKSVAEPAGIPAVLANNVVGTSMIAHPPAMTGIWARWEVRVLVGALPVLFVLLLVLLAH